MPPYTRARRFRNRTAPYARGSRYGTTSIPRSIVFKRDVSLLAKKAARNILLRSEETKRYNLLPADLTGANCMTFTYYYINIGQLITLGTAKDQRIGSQVKDVYIKMDFVVYTRGTDSLTGDEFSDVMFRAMIVKANNQLTGAAPTSNWTKDGVGPGNLFPNILLNDFQALSGRNTHDYKYYGDVGSITVPKPYPIPTGAAHNMGPGKLYRLRGKVGMLRWEDASPNWLKGDQLYIVIAAGVLSGSPGLTEKLCDVQATGAVFFKDA